MFKIKGFTLIELLIVVAIIAILAAIAIPNFLAAEIRAKVSRAKAEEQTLATALESYYIDYNSYADDVDPQRWPYYIPSMISTPIAYISSGLLQDPFRVNAPDSFPNSPGLRYRYINLDVESVPGTGHWAYSQANSDFPTPGPTADVEEGFVVYGKWRISSAGPDLNAGAYPSPGSPPNPPDGYSFGFDTLIPYDPSNGTVSGGDIIRSQANPDIQNPLTYQGL